MGLQFSAMQQLQDKEQAVKDEKARHNPFKQDIINNKRILGDLKLQKKRDNMGYE